MTPDDLQQIIAQHEQDRVEFTTSINNRDKHREAICAFSNDLPGHGEPGYLIIGLKDDGTSSKLEVTDQLLLQFASYRSDGQIQPTPHLSVHRVAHPDGNDDVLVVKVIPHSLPPIRYKGRTCIRIGPRKDYATIEEERLLIERRAHHFRTFDVSPALEVGVDRINLSEFSSYRQAAIAPEVIAENQRPLEVQLAALRCYNLKHDCPTNAGVLLFGSDPLDLFPGAYVQFVQYGGKDKDGEILAEKTIAGNLMQQLNLLTSFLEGRYTQRPISVSMLREKTVYDYPPQALRELALNAILHRDYDSTSPVRIYEYEDRIEISNPGGLYGESAIDFPTITAYRNPVIAEAMFNLGYVNRYGRGVIRAKSAMSTNGSPDLVFRMLPNYFSVTIYKYRTDDDTGIL